MLILPLLFTLFAGSDTSASEVEPTRIQHLADALRAYAPKYLTEEAALEHAQAALLAERPGIDAELLLAIAYRESRFNPRACPRKKCGSGVDWLWPVNPKKPPMLSKFICGPLQATVRITSTRTEAWMQCIALRDLTLGYEAGAASLGRKLASCKKKKRKDLTVCMLNGYRGRKASEASTLRRAEGFRAYATPANI